MDKLGRHFFWPIQASEYYLYYFHIWNQITHYGNRKYTFLIYLFIIICLYESINFTLLELLNTSELTRIVQVDFFRMLIPNRPGIGYALAAAALMSVYFYRLFYLKGEKESNWLLFEVIFRQKKSDYYYFTHHCGQPVYELMFQFSVKMFRLIQMANINTHIFLIHMSAFGLSKLMDHGTYFFFTLAGYGSLLLFLLNMLASGLCFFVSIHILSLIFVCSACLIRIGNVRCAQQYQMLRHFGAPDRLSRRQFECFHVYNTRTLKDLAHIVVYGDIFLIVLAYFTPLSILVFMWLALGHVQDPVTSIFVLLFQWGQLTVLFGEHLVMSQFTAKLHRPVQLLLRFVPRSGLNKGPDTRLDLATRLRMDRLICDLHSNKRYGLTYGRFGLITLATFAKYLQLYGKFCMITYKLLQTTE